MEIPVGGIRGLNIGRLLNNVCTVSLFLRGGGGGGRCLDIFLFFFFVWSIHSRGGIWIVIMGFFGQCFIVNR